VLIQVKGGTGAGRRRVKTRPPWSCRCVELFVNAAKYVVHSGEVYSCGKCGARRPA
jgi:predicted SprT family Zn-dependent metalloprotease